MTLTTQEQAPSTEPERDESKISFKNQDGKGAQEESVPKERLDRALKEWEADREESRNEIKRLKDQLRSRNVLEAENEDAFDGLDEDERIEKIIELREQKRVELAKAEKLEMFRQLRFMRASDPFFDENEKEILAYADKTEEKDLKKATLMYRGLMKEAESTVSKHEDSQRKRSGEARPSSASSGKPSVGRYDPKQDGNKSIAQMYREHGI